MHQGKEGRKCEDTFLPSFQVPLRASIFAFSYSDSELTQQDDRKKRAANHLRVTNVTRLLLACLVS